MPTIADALRRAYCPPRLGALIISFSLAAPVAAGQVEELQAAVTAHDRGDYSSSLRTHHLLADQGNAEAQFNLGLFYDQGKGVPQNYTEAMRWYRKAAERGIAEAELNIGLMYDEGRGVPENDLEAVGWYQKAAERGNATAQFNLGLSYTRGEGVPQDYVQAHKWFNMAGARLPASKSELRDLAVTNREIVAKKMTPAQVAEAQQLARAWKPTQTGPPTAGPSN